MDKTEFVDWRDRMGFKTHKAAADALGVSYNTERAFCDGSRDVPQYIENLCRCLEELKTGKAEPAATKAQDERQGSGVAGRIPAENAAATIAEAYIDAVRKERPVASMVLDRAVVVSDLNRPSRSVISKASPNAALAARRALLRLPMESNAARLSLIRWARGLPSPFFSVSRHRACASSTMSLGMIENRHCRSRRAPLLATKDAVHSASCCGYGVNIGSGCGFVGPARGMKTSTSSVTGCPLALAKSE